MTVSHTRAPSANRPGAPQAAIAGSSVFACRIARGPGPLIATAIHDGHAVRSDIAGVLSVDEPTRFREEDPYTGCLATVAPNRLVALRSRFEVDLNRPRENAVYRTPEEAWGLRLWRTAPSEPQVAASLETYDAFYALVAEVITDVIARSGRFLLLDLHSYNHRRDGPEGPAADPISNPDINVGTGSVDLDRWAGPTRALIEGLAAIEFSGRTLNVGENVKFHGGHFSQWVNTHFKDHGVSLAIEFKKVFMDEWTGRCDMDALRHLRDGLSGAGAVAVQALGEA